MENVTQGTSFPVMTDARMFPVIVVGMGEEPRLREKPAPTGEATYASGCVLLVQGKDGSARANKSASVHVTKPAGIYELGKKYVAQGRVWVQPYESNNRVTYSITCEQLVPADRPAAPTGEQK